MEIARNVLRHFLSHSILIDTSRLLSVSEVFNVLCLLYTVYLRDSLIEPKTVSSCDALHSETTCRVVNFDITNPVSHRSSFARNKILVVQHTISERHTISQQHTIYQQHTGDIESESIPLPPALSIQPRLPGKHFFLMEKQSA